MTDTARLLDPFRLPRDARPTRYDVTLEPDLAAATFSGAVVIRIIVDEVGDSTFADRGELVLNAAELDIVRCLVDGAPAEHRLDEDTERLFIRPTVDGADHRVVPGEHTVEIVFTGVLNDKLRGFYRSTFHDEGGVERVIATSQMQATDCRRAFPCWDEPDFKAVFGITLVIEPDLLAVSNGRELDRREITTGNGAKVAVRFADTMLMSTYLAAFVVGPLEVTEPVDVGGVPLRVVHVPGKAHLTGFGLDVGAFCLRWFQEYYGIPYPSDKVDLLALPDFAAGAMENLGCITFRESLLLVDPATSTQYEQEVVADVVAHELAHMWFGDLVTMGWWNGIWLNEAFATFMEILACDAYRPDWERWTSFGLERSVAFETDSLVSTRSVEYEVRSPADCEGMFDVLTYQKGGALLRMLEQYLGADRFREGVSHYLTTHAYANTDTSDLWDAIEDTSGEPVRRTMDSWIWQPGFPLITATLDGDQLVLRQSPFSFDVESTSATLWMVPITVRHGGHVDTLLLDGHEARLTLADPAAAVVVNAGGHGFFRVSYDDELRARLIGDALRSLDTLERYNLVDDAWNAVIAGRLAATDLLTFLEGFGDEREYAVWQAIVFTLRGLGRLLDDDAFARLQRRVARLVAPALTDLGDPVESETDLVGKLRGLLTSALAVLGDDAATQARCRELYDRSMSEPGSVDPELVAAATSVVAATGGEAEYERMLSGFRTAATPQDQLRHLYALAEFNSAELIDRTCEFALSSEVKTQNAPFLLRSCISNRRHGGRAWTFVRKNWAEVNERFPSNTIIRMVDTVKTLNRPTDVADIQAFFSEHPIEQAAKTLEQILERQRVNAAMREREQDALAAALP
ncbi:MAG TPA: M1 family metallopeptidase [Ilumatobacteraceae bacterium]|nr:M1 family metallopeptidase [Ilumatobacteraceae bacterium]